MTRARLAALALACAAVAAGCAAAGPSGSGRATSASRPAGLEVTTTTLPAATSGLRTISDGRLTLQVPASWPVYTLAGDPGRCVRFDVHAVYLGHQGPDARCPAQLLGKTEAVQIEPLDAQSRQQVAPGGLPVALGAAPATLAPSSAISHQLVLTVPAAGAVVTVTFGTDEPTAQQVARSIRVTP